jgi:hypothetical protein
VGLSQNLPIEKLAVCTKDYQLTRNHVHIHCPMDGAMVMIREKPKARGLTPTDLLPDSWECREGIRLILSMMEAANALPICQVCSGAENSIVLKSHYNLKYKFRARL